MPESSLPLFVTLFRVKFFTLIRKLFGEDQPEMTTDSQRATVLLIDCLEKKIRLGFGVLFTTLFRAIFSILIRALWKGSCR